jgi:hypothetical protein
VGEKSNAYSLEETIHIEDLSVEGKIILNWNLMKLDRRVWTILFWYLM